MAPEIDVRDLNSVRRAAKGAQDGDVVLGDDYVAPATSSDRELLARRKRRGLVTLNRSPLARKIITFNLLALIILVAGVLYLNPSRDNLAFQRANALVSEAQLIADVFEAQLPAGAPVNLVTGDGVDTELTLSILDLRGGVEVFVFDPSEVLVGRVLGSETGGGTGVDGLSGNDSGTIITDFLNTIWDGVSGLLSPSDPEVVDVDSERDARALVAAALGGNTQVDTANTGEGGTIFTVATPILQNGVAVGVVALTSAAGEIDGLVRREREQVLQMFVIGIMVSIGLSLVLASTIANPLSDLAAAAELGRDKNARKMSPNRVRIPDLTARPDEIGRLSGALRGMVAALYERIEGNEQFAADVAHEIKNPLASLRSAVGTMRVAKRDDQRE
jgi:two-component system sensor histidine kinase ChvG